MKKRMLLIVILITVQGHGVHAATLGKVIKIQGNLILVRFESQKAREGDTVHIDRETDEGLVPVGTARVMRIAGDQAGAKILTRYPGVSVLTGDLITDGKQPYTASASSFSDLEIIDNNAALEKLLLISNPVPVLEIDTGFQEMTALEKIRYQLQNE